MNSKQLSRESVVVGSADHVSCEVADEVVILSLENGEYFGLNPVAARIWTLIQTPMSVAAIQGVLLDEYADITPDACYEQVVALLTEMLELELAQLG